MNLREADRAIFNAWCGGLVITIWSLIRASLAMITANEENLWLAILLIPETIVFGALTYGVHHKSRVCAALLLIVFLPSQIIRLLSTINLWAIGATVVLGFTFLQGIIGTINYQKIRQAQQGKES